jgi:hypothetical protein
VASLLSETRHTNWHESQTRMVRNAGRVSPASIGRTLLLGQDPQFGQAIPDPPLHRSGEHPHLAATTRESAVSHRRNSGQFRAYV